jgi:hypothetical protein
MIARIAAARLSKWLEREVLPGQDVLTDAPHLVSRFPSLLKGDPSEQDSWNRTAAFGTPDQLGIRDEVIEKLEYKQNYWLSRAAWFWKDVTNVSRIPEVSEPWEKRPPKFVFAEDASRFYPEKDCREFLASVESPFVRRFVRFYGKNEVDYAPKVRILS